MMVDFLPSIHVEFEEAFCVGLSFIRVVPCQERLKGEKLSASINGSGQVFVLEDDLMKYFTSNIAKLKMCGQLVMERYWHLL